LSDTAAQPVGLDEPELRAAVHHLVGQMVEPAREQHGPLPGVGTPRWWTAPADVQLAALLVLAEAHLIADPVRAARALLRELSHDLSNATDWKSLARHHATPGELETRRARAGPLARRVDPHAAAHWAATGTSGAEVTTT
jgi:hypothetical protein